ncbi:MAG: hypothetical protein MUF49_09575 [Oculatellaceae cyanobacterium Prado106]|nr:hypothetical protein [Oculatellaceae cyanobacterium Prado106]
MQVTQKKGFGRFKLATRWKRAYRNGKANQVWYLLIHLATLELALACYAERFSIEPMFRDFKEGGYDMEACQANGERFEALVLLIAVAYTIASERGKRIRRKQVQRYGARVQEPRRREKRHSDFWIGLYGTLWVDSMDGWST